MNKIIILIFSALTVSLQSQVVHLETAINNHGVQEGTLDIKKPGTWHDVYPEISTIPEQYAEPQYIHEIIDYAQVVYQSCRSLNDKIWNDKRLHHMINRWGIDTLDCSSNRINSFINGSVVKGNDFKLYFSLDTDNDLSLSDEKFYKVDEIPLDPISIVFERFSNSEVFKDTITIRINDIRFSNNGKVERIIFDFLTYKQATIDFDEASVKLSVVPGRYNSYSSEAQLTFEEPSGRTSSVSTGQYWAFGSRIFQVANLSKSGRTVELLALPSDTIPYSNQVGFPTPPIFKEHSDIVRNTDFEYTYIYFWNIDCAPCLQELPQMQKSYDAMLRFGESDFQVILVSVDKPKRTKDFLKRKKITFQNMETFGNDTLYNEYGIGFFPSKYLVDQDGIILHTPNNRLEFKTFWALREK